MTLKRMDNIGIVVDDLEGMIDFFRELGLELEGRSTIEGEWAERNTTTMTRATDVGERDPLYEFTASEVSTVLGHYPSP